MWFRLLSNERRIFYSDQVAAYYDIEANQKEECDFKKERYRQGIQSGLCFLTSMAENANPKNKGSLVLIYYFLYKFLLKKIRNSKQYLFLIDAKRFKSLLSFKNKLLYYYLHVKYFLTDFDYSQKN